MFGLVLVDDQLMIREGMDYTFCSFFKFKLNSNFQISVLTLYEKGGGKVAKHSWVSEATSIGAVSYIPVKLWQQIPHQPLFRSAWYRSTLDTSLPRFHHLLPSRFLLDVLSSSRQILANGMMELSKSFFDNIFLKISSQKPAIINGVRDLTARRARGKAQQKV
jgi:hypothetical protein